MDICVVCCKVKCRTNKTNNQVRMKYEQSRREHKKIPQMAWMSLSCECCVLSGRGLCDGPITCSEESYRLWRVACVI
jgi:hypothetical protein